MRRLPAVYLLSLVTILAAASLMVLVAFGVIPIDGLVFFFASNVVLFIPALVLTALGGAFVGMILAQRIFSAKEFTPLERSLVEATAGLREIREGQEAILRKIDEIEQRLGKRP